MPERDGFDPGTPSWVDLSTPDPEGARRFYGELFGWDHTEPGPVEETGGYAMFTSGGKLVAGVGPVMQEGSPAYWSTYFATDDADALTERVTSNGGTVIVAPMDVMEAGRMAIYSHPDAGMFGTWQAGEHKGAQLVNEPVSLAWNALMTRNQDSANTFLHAVFGLRAQTQDFGAGPYTILMLGDWGVGGVSDMPPGVPDEAPAFWAVSFAVEDADATVARAQELGGSVAMPLTDMAGVGRIASLIDPHGAVFGIVALAPQG
jgi:predicted enzyme related to lactoylglutathione lyase